jgi:serine/threonine protein kinase
MGCGTSSQHSAAIQYVEIPICPLSSKYKLLRGRCLGKGSFGVVHIGEELCSGTQYALKAVPRESTSDWEAPSMYEFKQTVEILTGLSHPRVVRLHEYFASARHTYMVFPIFWGGCVVNGMKRHWAEKGDIPIESIRNVWRQMTEGIAYIHSKHITHQDVKPDNFLMDALEIDNPHVNVGISDFDFAVRTGLGSDLTTVCGTKQYFAPEMVTRKPKFGMKVDVWALGVILNALVSREFLFHNDLEIRFKDIVVPHRLPSEAGGLFLDILNRDDQSRISASKILEHLWLAPVASPSVSSPAKPLSLSPKGAVETIEVPQDDDLPMILKGQNWRRNTRKTGEEEWHQREKSIATWNPSYDAEFETTL